MMNKNKLIIVDNFADRPHGLRDAALSLSYEPQKHNGHIYQGIGLGFTPDLQGKIEETIGSKIKINMSFFRSGKTDVQMNTFIHVDFDCGEYASVLYLNTPEQKFGGTAFWRHKRTGLDCFDPSMQITQAEADQWNDEGKREELWEMTDLVGMKFNRFVTYSTQRFHSRYPFLVEADSVKSGRLVWVTFYDKA